MGYFAVGVHGGLPQGVFPLFIAYANAAVKVPQVGIANGQAYLAAVFFKVFAQGRGNRVNGLLFSNNLLTVVLGNFH